jgi:hypothetical protein
MTNMSFDLYFCMSAEYICVTYCMSNVDIAGFCACRSCTSLCFETTYFGGILQCLNTSSVLVQSLDCDLEVPSSNPIHVCDGFLVILSGFV